MVGNQGAQIRAIHAREILDSRGNPTLEAEVVLYSGIMARASVPSGASTGLHEAAERRDKTLSRYGGKGVQQVAAQLLQECQQLYGLDVLQQGLADQRLCAWDGTSNKTRLGANAVLALSIAMARAAAQYLQVPLYRYLGGAFCGQLPVPFMNLINGGAHANNGLWVQEYMVVPCGFPTFSEALRAGVEVFTTVKKLLQQRGLSTAVGDEGGYAPSFSSAEEAFVVLQQAIEQAGYEPGRQISLAVDVAASGYWDAQRKQYGIEGTWMTAHELIQTYQHWCEQYPLVSIEDGLGEEDWAGWQQLTQALGSQVQLVGDDLFVTQRARLEEGRKRHAANAILIKPNQVGTLTETWDTIRAAHRWGYRTMVSHRSGETEDTLIADLSVAAGSGQIKTGAPCRGERVSKYNRLLQIEEELGAAAWFAGTEDPLEAKETWKTQ